jgi:PAS domain S-box-containing protein
MLLGVDLFFALFNNLAIFIALVGVYGYVTARLKQSPWYIRQLLLGLVFGMFAIGCMYAKIPVFKGVIVDQRNAIIALSGFFGGPFAAYLSAAFAGAFRLYLGGQGAFAGVIGVTLAATAGVLLSKRHQPFGSTSKAMTSALLATIFILPGFLFVQDFQTGLSLLKSMSGPYGLAIFLGIFTVGLLLHREENKIEIEELLSESEEKFKALADTSPLAIYMSTGLEQQAEYINPTFTRLLGYSIDEVPTAGHWFPLAYPDENYRRRIEAEWQKKVACAIDTNSKIEPMETVVTCKDGSKRTMSWEFINIGKQSWASGLDLTEIRNATEELVKYRDKLQVLVDEQTSELREAQAELLQKERLATLGQLTATVSHELRNPLGTIQSALFSIEDSIERNQPDRVRRSLQLAERSIDRCVNIIEELNSYARVKKLDISEVSLDPWLQTTIDDLNIPEDILFEMDLSCGAQIQCDKAKLQQVIINLINNSVHALQDKHSNGKLLQLSTRLLDGICEIKVCDNGVGMSKDTKEKAFEPLFSTKGFGVGLGMVVVKNIIEQHHGKVCVESKEGEGTSVSIRLPIRRPE